MNWTIKFKKEFVMISRRGMIAFCMIGLVILGSLFFGILTHAGLDGVFMSDSRYKSLLNETARLSNELEAVKVRMDSVTMDSMATKVELKKISEECLARHDLIMPSCLKERK